MCIRLRYKASVLILLACFSVVVSAATYKKTVTMPTAAESMSTGTPNMAASILEVGMQGVELIEAGASESRAVATVTKGISVPVSGIVSTLKTGLKANAGSLAVGAVISGLIAGVDWVMTDGVLTKQSTGTDPVTTASGEYQWTVGTNGTAYSTAEDACFAKLDETWSASWEGRFTKTMGAITVSGSNVYAACTATITSNNTLLGSAQAHRIGTGCPANSTYDSSVGACIGAGSTALVDSDYDVLDGFVQNKDGVWTRDLADELCQGALNYNSCMSEMGAVPLLTGPATVSSPETTTTTSTQNADGTSTEVSTKTKTDYQLGYDTSTATSPTITVDPKTTTTTTTTTKDSTGTTTGTDTTTSETTTSTTGSGTEISDGTYTDTPFPEVGPFYEQKYPDGFQGVWDDNKATFDASALIQFLNSFVPSFSGSCPSWTLNFDIMPHAHFGSHEFGSLCDVFAFVKVIILVSAMFLCRALIFGG